MSYLITCNPCIHSPSIITLLYSMDLSVDMLRKCMGREESRIGILIRLIQWSCILFLFIFQTCSLYMSEVCNMIHQSQSAGSLVMVQWCGEGLVHIIRKSIFTTACSLKVRCRWSSDFMYLRPL